MTPWTVACQAPLSMGILQVRILEWVAMSSSPGDLPNPGIEPRSPALLVDSIPSEPPGKPKNTGVGSLSLLQWIFLTQESNRLSCIAGGFFTNRVTREASWSQGLLLQLYNHSGHQQPLLNKLAPILILDKLFI